MVFCMLFCIWFDELGLENCITFAIKKEKCECGKYMFANGFEKL